MDADQEPGDDIDLTLMNAVDMLMTEYAGDFTLGGDVRHVDLRGSDGPPMSVTTGYLQQQNNTYRVFTITLPVIVNDAWDEAS